MRRFPMIALLAVAACGPKGGSKLPSDNFDADARSGPDGKRSTAQRLDVNKPHTDEINFLQQDRTDWYVVDLKGKPNQPVLTTVINWDNVNSDVNVDVFDPFGAQIAASPVRGKGEKQKTLYVPIPQPGTYYIRVTAPTKMDGTVYTMEAQWQEPPPVVVGRAAAARADRRRAAGRGEAAAPSRDARAARAAREAVGREHRGARGLGVSRGRGAHDVHRQGLVGRHQAGRLGRGAVGRRRRGRRRRRQLPHHQGDRRQQVRRLGVDAFARQEQSRVDHAGR